MIIFAAYYYVLLGPLPPDLFWLTSATLLGNALSLMALQQLIYRSTAIRAWSDEELDRLVAQARIHNYSYAITGVLLYADRQFLQLLEGEPAAIEQMYQHIVHDSRHTHITLLVREPVPQRLFPHWSLGFRKLFPVALAQLSGYLDPRYRADLLPSTCNAQEVIADLLREFIGELAPGGIREQKGSLQA